MQENKFTINKQYDLHKEDDVRAILEQGNAEEIERLRRHSSLSREQIERLRYYALLRQGVHQQMQQKLELRIKNNPQASQQEIEMGCYLENIEPHVRTTVMKMRNKGYNTYESGFFGVTGQKISTENRDFDNPQLFVDLVSELANQGIKLEIKKNVIFFECDGQLPLSEIEKTWLQIESYLPDLKKVPVCHLRKQQNYLEINNSIDK